MNELKRCIEKVNERYFAGLNDDDQIVRVVQQDKEVYSVLHEVVRTWSGGKRTYYIKLKGKEYESDLTGLVKVDGKEKLGFITGMEDFVNTILWHSKQTK